MKQQIKSCIILAGGFGTRLQNVVNDVPKCLAPIAGLPFLYYLLNYLKTERFTHVVLSLGYKSDLVVDFIKINQAKYPSMNIDFVIENEPLGTGGALRLASEKIISNDFYIFNGDTFFQIPTDELSKISSNQSREKILNIALKRMYDFDRYGTVVQNANGLISSFKEKKHQTEGLINGGIYYMTKNVISSFPMLKPFSFEKDILENVNSDISIYGKEFDNYFIDIGVPEDYKKANIDLKHFI